MIQNNPCSGGHLGEPNFFIDYQDCQYVPNSKMLCDGITNLPQTPAAGGTGATDELGGMAMIDLKFHSVIRDVPFQHWSTAGHVATRNPFKMTADGNHLTMKGAPDNGDEGNGNGTEIITRSHRHPCHVTQPCSRRDTEAPCAPLQTDIWQVSFGLLPFSLDSRPAHTLGCEWESGHPVRSRTPPPAFDAGESEPRSGPGKPIGLPVEHAKAGHQLPAPLNRNDWITPCLIQQNDSPLNGPPPPRARQPWRPRR
jgi:hypothetical protein